MKDIFDIIWINWCRISTKQVSQFQHAFSDCATVMVPIIWALSILHLCNEKHWTWWSIMCSPAFQTKVIFFQNMTQSQEMHKPLAKTKANPKIPSLYVDVLQAPWDWNHYPHFVDRCKYTVAGHTWRASELQKFFFLGGFLLCHDRLLWELEFHPEHCSIPCQRGREWARHSTRQLVPKWWRTWAKTLPKIAHCWINHIQPT